MMGPAIRTATQHLVTVTRHGQINTVYTNVSVIEEELTNGSPEYEEVVSNLRRVGLPA